MGVKMDSSGPIFIVPDSNNSDGPIFVIPGPSNSSGGLSGALMALVFWINSINHLSAEFADLATANSLAIKDISDAENHQLTQDNADFKDSTKASQEGYDLSKSDDLNHWYTKCQNQYNLDQSSFNAKITQAQTQMNAKTNYVDDLTKETTGPTRIWVRSVRFPLTLHLI